MKGHLQYQASNLLRVHGRKFFVTGLNMKSEIIRQSHERCMLSKTDFNTVVMSEKENSHLDAQLNSITWNCLKNIKSSFFTLYNSFFTLSDKDLVVINHFINKNSNVDMKKYTPPIGTSLREQDYGTTATSLAKLKGDVAYVTKGEHINAKSKDLTCVAAPLRLDKTIVGYLSISTLNSKYMDVLRPFIECLSLNIGYELKKYNVRNCIMENLENGNSVLMNKKILDYLTDGEKKVLHFLFMNYSNEMIAKNLYISESAVRKTLVSIYRKTGTSNKLDTIIKLIYKDMFSII